MIPASDAHRTRAWCGRRQELLGVVEARADVGFIRPRSASYARRGMDAYTDTWTFRRLSTALPAEQRSALCLRSLSLWTVAVAQTPRRPHWVRSKGRVESLKVCLFGRGALCSASALPAPPTAVTARAAQVLIDGFVRQPRRRSGVSRLRSRATASPGGSEREEPVGRHAWKSSEPEASCAPFETLALLAEQQSRATRGPPALPFEERSRSLVRWSG